jgi:hypothetical protein
MNRREWLSLAATASAYALTPVVLRGEAGARDGLSHGLFIDQARLPQMRKVYSTHPLFAELRSWHGAFDYAGNLAWIRDELRTNDQLIGLARLGDLIEEAAFIALATEDSRAEQFVVAAMEKAMAFDRWDFFLDGDQPIAVQRASHMTVTVAFVIDSMGTRVAPEVRRQWVDAMWERGCQACYRTIEDIRHPRTVEGWRFDPDSTFFEHRPGNRTDMNRRPEITYNTNLRAVPASALILGTVLYELERGSSAQTRRFREMGLWGMEGFREFFKADGSYDEEVNYAAYTALHLTQAIIALKRTGGEDLTDLINWGAYAEYQLNMVMPTDQHPYAIVNWGDSGQTISNDRGKNKRTALPSWIAATYKDSLAQALVTGLSGSQSHWSAMWFDSSVPDILPPNEPKLWVSELDRVVARTGYRAEDLVVAMRSGPPANHEHADRNSIIVKCFGEELVTDPLRPPYSYSDPSWRMRLTEGHSAVLIDGRGHEHHNGIEGTNASNAFARILEHASDPTLARWISDATQPYRLVDTDIRRVVRSMAVLYQVPAVIVVDKVLKWETASTVQARFFGYNLDGRLEAEALEDGFRIGRPGAYVRAHVWANVAYSVKVAKPDVAADIAERHPFVAVNTVPSMEILLVTILMPGKRGEGVEPVRILGGAGALSIEIGTHRLRIDAASGRVTA